MNEERKKFLEQLIKTPSPSGDEVAIQKLWIDEVKEYADKIETDYSGNAIAILNPEASFKVLLAGHCDEIALMVNHIDEKGFIYVTNVGGINPKLALANRVRILGRNSVVKGVVGVKPEHVGGPKDKIKMEDLVIDCGVTKKEELQNKVETGDYVIYDVDFDYLMNNRFVGRGLDNRTGAFIIAEVLKELSKQDINVGVYAVSTVNEETSMGGAYFAAAKIEPSMAIACDVSHATDCADLDLKKYGDIKLGNGPIVAKGSQNNYKINDFIKQVAKDNNINIQQEQCPEDTGTDADKMRFTGKGVPVATVSLPLRYMHSPSEVVSLDDIEEEIKLLTETIKNLTGTENLKPLE